MQDNKKKFDNQNDTEIILSDEEIERIHKILQNQIADMTKNMQDALIVLQNSLGSFKETIYPALKSYHGLPPRLQKAIKVIGDRGWWLDLRMTTSNLWSLENAIEKGRFSEVDAELVAYFEGRLDEIENVIIKNFPEREILISSAFKAHRRSEYELSIPVFLAQTEGICVSVIKKSPFSKRDGKPQTSGYVDQIALTKPINAAILTLFEQVLPINVSKNERAKDFEHLNRHMVLHGESLDYGTKVNSLKAISQINYVVQMLKSETK